MDLRAGTLARLSIQYPCRYNTMSYRDDSVDEHTTFLDEEKCKEATGRRRMSLSSYKLLTICNAVFFLATFSLYTSSWIQQAKVKNPILRQAQAYCKLLSQSRLGNANGTSSFAGCCRNSTGSKNFERDPVSQSPPVSSARPSEPRKRRRLGRVGDNTGLRSDRRRDSCYGQRSFNSSKA